MTNLLDEVNEPETIDPNKDYLQDLVGEGKKFKTVQDLARGKYESDMFIETLKRMNDQMRQDYIQAREENVSRAKLEDLLDQLKEKQSSSEHTPSQAKEQEKPGFNPDELESLVSSKIQQHELSKKQDENFKIVRDKLRERFGTRYQDTLREQIENLGLTEDDVTALARKSPTAFFKTMGLDVEPQRESFQAPPRSAQRTTAFRPQTQKRTWTYYEDIRKKDPKLYYDPKTVTQMHKDYQELGSDFEDGNFRAV